MSAQRLAFICPRFSEKGTVGGAETLLKALAEHAANSGRKVSFLTTCAQDHFSWKNSVPPGLRRFGNLDVHYFPVDERDLATFLRVQESIDRRLEVSDEDELGWIRNSVNSTALYDHLREHGADYDRLVMGPYLFGLTWSASRIAPEKTLLVPCLHDEPFAYLRLMKQMFQSVRGFMFNTEPERDLARRLYDLPEGKCSVVGIGLDAFEADPKAFAARRGLAAPYVIYSGRREPLKGTPLLCSYVQAFRERTNLDLNLVFTGSGPIEAPPELQPHILDVGFVSEQEKHEAMAGAVAFIHPSVNESLGIVLLESWLARTPAIAHAKSEVLRWQCQRSGAGLWFRYYPDFEEELMLLLTDRRLRQRLGESGRQYVLKEWSWEAVGRRLFASLDNL